MSSLPPKSPDTSRSSITATIRAWLRTWVAGHTQWIVKNLTWSKIKPVIRCAVVAWVSLVLFVIPKVEFFFGQASFLILVSAFLAPPGDPFIAVLERAFIILFLVAMAWAWTSLGIFLANLARRVHNPAVTIFDVANGQYIEAGPTVIFGVFLFLGSAFVLYVKARQGPGPFFFASIFACIFLDLIIPTAVLYPFPFYMLGRSVIIPLVFAAAIALLGSILIFPSTITSQFTTRLQAVLTPLISAIELHRTLLNTPFPTDSNSSSSSMDLTQYTQKLTAASASIKASEAALGPLAACARLMNSDLIYSRFSPSDFKAFQMMCRQMSGRVNGLSTFFSLVGVGPEAEMGLGPDRSLDISAHTLPHSSSETPVVGTSLHEGKPTSSPSSPHSIRSPSINSPASSLHPRHPHHDHHSHHPLRASLLPRPSYDKPNKAHETEHAVGAFESQRYLNLEATTLWDPNWEDWTSKSLQALGESCNDVLEACRDGLTAVKVWLGGARHGRITYLLGMRRKERDEQIAENIKRVKELRTRISGVLQSFCTDKRLLILEPYAPGLKTATSPDTSAKSKLDIFDHFLADEDNQMPHRYLFRSYFYQYHLKRVCAIVIDMLDEIIKLEEKRTHDRLWTPVGKIFAWNKRFFPEDEDKIEDQDPDVIPGLQHDLEDENDRGSSSDDLGMPRMRNPDALPPRNSAEWVMALIHSFVMGLGGGNAIYAAKAGALTILLCLPSFLKSSAQFAYDNKFFWGIFMGQLTLARFRGDTVFGLVSRIFSTFFGALTGTVIWYISCGSSKGNPYGLATICGVLFPFLFFARLYAPISPLTNAIYFVTIALIVGFSYLDIYFVLPNSPGFGWTIAWRRFVLVMCGVIAAFLASFLPPSTTIRKYHRRLLSTTSIQLGTVYCDILSFATSKSESEIQEIISCLLAIRAKLNHSLIISANIDYEVSLAGRWPKDRYRKIVDLQMAISHALANLISVLEHLEPSWARAFLRRTRFTDPDFQGDVLAVISMIASALRTGCPLPQITPCPLLDRFLLQYHGLNVIHKDAGEDYGLPRSITFETLKNEQYLMFSVGITTAVRIINRLDQLMLATKEVVGEHYHIHGVGGGASAIPILKEGPRQFAAQFQPPGDDVV